MSNPVRRLVAYRPKPGSYASLELILRQAGRVLRDLGLVTQDGVRLYRAIDDDRDGKSEPYFIETFKWRDEHAPDEARRTPAVSDLWKAMEAHLGRTTITTLE
jgi:hypothetical protein